MVITTRDSAIANEAGSVVTFDVRVPTGPASKAIFFKHADITDSPGDMQFEKMLRRLLEFCRGLPLLLAVVGRRLADEDSHDAISVRMGIQVRELERESRRLQVYQESVPNNYPRSLHAAVMLSLKFLGRKLNYGRRDLSDPYTVEQMFRSLSMLSNQGWVPISVLNRLWRTDANMFVQRFNRLRLVTRTSRSWKNYGTNEEVEEDGVTLHDLTLDICRMEARSCRELIFWHNALLHSYHAAAPRKQRVAPLEECTTAGSYLSLSERHRQWWSRDVPEDGYIHSNLSRHLVAAGKQKELWGLLLNPKWSQLWIRFGNLLALQRDVATLVEAVNSVSNVSQLDLSSLEELQLIYKALRCAWGRIEKNPREYQYQMLGRLHDARESMRVVDFFLSKVETSAQKPWLRPLHQCFGLEMLIPVESGCRSVAYLPCGKLVAAAVGKEVQVVNVECGKVLRKCSGHCGLVCHVAVSPDGMWIVSRSRDEIRVWEAETGCQTGKTIQIDSHGQLSDNFSSLDVREDREGLHIVAIVSGTVKAWDLSSQTTLAYSVDEEFLNADSLSCSGDGRLLVRGSSSTRTLKTWHMKSGSQVGKTLHFPPDCGHPTSIAVSQDGKLVACGTSCGNILVWKPSSSKREAEKLTGHRGDIFTLAISKNTKRLFSGSSKGDVHVWNLENKTMRSKLIGKHGNAVTGIAISPDGTLLVSGSLDMSMRIWDLENCVPSNVRPRSPKMTLGQVNCVSSSADGRLLASGHSYKTVQLWDAESGDPVGKPLRGHLEHVTCAAFSPDGCYVVSGSPDKTVRVWCTQTGKAVGQACSGHLRPVQCVATSPDGRRVVSGSVDRTLRIWDITTGEAVGNPLYGHSKTVSYVTFSPDGRFIISGSHDKTIRVWNAATGKRVGDPLLGHSNTVRQICVNKDSSLVYSSSCRQEICWNLETRENCSLRQFAQSRATVKAFCFASFRRNQPNTLECVCATRENEVVLAQMQNQAHPISWHIDYERNLIYVGLHTGSIMRLKVEI